MNKTKSLEIGWHHLRWKPDASMLYEGRRVVEVRELRNGMTELRYSDANGVPLPDSPKIMCRPLPGRE